MSLEWARARALENLKRGRERAQAIRGADAPEIEMVFPLNVTFWGESQCPVEAMSDRSCVADQLRETPALGTASATNHEQVSEGVKAHD